MDWFKKPSLHRSGYMCIAPDTKSADSLMTGFVKLDLSFAGIANIMCSQSLPEFYNIWESSI
jgi:hypothetical protein